MMVLSPQPIGRNEAFHDPGSQLTVSTWNVWFDKTDRPRRNEALLAELGENPPDVCCFQEVTPPFVRALQACPWMKNGYWISGTHHQEIGVVMVSRLKVKKIFFHPLPSKMGRRLLVADFGPIIIANCHFESSGTGAEMREKQFEECWNFLSGKEPFVLLGDFNCGPHAQEYSKLASRLTDVWSTLKPGDPGFTFDTEQNSAAASLARSEVRVRMDRILTSPGLEWSSVERLGLKALKTTGGELHCSDHFGLKASITGLRA